MEELLPTTDIFDNSGTNNLPINVGWVGGLINTKGKKHVHKIGELWYESFVKRKGKKFWTFRCRDYRKGCGWIMRMKPIDSDENSPDFWDRENWIILADFEREVHTCPSIPSAEISHTQFLNFLRRKMTEGVTDFKTIRTLSKIDEKYAQAASLHLKDERHYKKSISLFKKKKYGHNVNNEIPGDLKVINTYDSVNKIMTEEPFYFLVDGIEIFGIPSLFKVKIYLKFVFR